MKSSIQTKVKADQLPLMESFLTLQGEGFHSGKLSWFIRLGGCDVGCVWCDVKESWDADQHPVRSVEEIAGAAASTKAGIAVITGGEPLMYDLNELTGQLKSRGLRTHIETSGVYPLTGKWDWICFSPKKFRKPKQEFYFQAHELKVVIYHKSDLRWAEEHAQEMHEDALLYLQPEWSKREEMIPLIIDHIREHPKWQVSLQAHKYINIP